MQLSIVATYAMWEHSKAIRDAEKKANDWLEFVQKINFFDYIGITHYTSYGETLVQFQTPDYNIEGEDFPTMVEKYVFKNMHEYCDGYDTMVAKAYDDSKKQFVLDKTGRFAFAYHTNPTTPIMTREEFMKQFGWQYIEDDNVLIASAFGGHYLQLVHLRYMLANSTRQMKEMIGYVMFAFIKHMRGQEIFRNGIATIDHLVIELGRGKWSEEEYRQFSSLVSILYISGCDRTKFFPKGVKVVK